MNRLIREAILSWMSWRQKRRIYRAMPWQQELDAKEAEARRHHRKIRDIQKQRKQAMLRALGGGNG